MTEQALSTDNTDEAASCLEYVVWYYPSGSKQEHGSKLDLLVEKHRKSAANAIIRHLRELTGKDLGNAPEAWLREFNRQSINPENNHPQ